MEKINNKSNIAKKNSSPQPLNHKGEKGINKQKKDKDTELKLQL